MNNGIKDEENSLLWPGRIRWHCTPGFHQHAEDTGSVNFFINSLKTSREDREGSNMGMGKRQ